MNFDRIHASTPRIIPRSVRYPTALLIVALCAVGRFSLDRWIGNAMPFALFFVGVAFTTYLCGMRPAIASIVLSGVVVNFYYLQPGKPFHLEVKVLVAELAFCFFCALVVVGVDALSKARARVLYESEKYARILAGISDALMILDDDWRLFHLNEKARTLLDELGAAGKELTGENIWEVAPILKGGEFEREMERIKNAKLSSAFEIHFPTLRRWMDVSVHSSAEGVTVLFRDITEKKTSEAKLRETETRFQALFSQAAVGMAIASLDGKFQQVNGRFSDILGYTAEELSERTFSELTYPEDLPKTEVMVRGLLAGKINDYNLEKRYIRKDGSLVWSLTTVTLMKDSEGNPSWFIGVIEEISQRKKAEEALRTNETLLRTVTNESRVGLVMVDKDRRYLFGNSTYAEILGLANAEIVGRRVEDLLPGVYHEQIKPKLDLAFSGERVTYELQLASHPRDGRQRIYEVVYEPRNVMTNDPYVVVVIMDITVRRHAAEVLEARERELSLIYSNVSDGVYYLSVEPGERYRFLSVNRAFTKATGLTMENVIGKLVNEIVPERSLKMLLGNYGKAIREKAPVSWEEGTFYGEAQRHGVVSISPVFNEEGECVHLIGTVHDITQRKQAEDKFLYQKALLEAVTESVLDGILVVSPTGDVLHMNQRFQEIWKFPAEVRASGSDELALEWAAKQTVAPEQFRKRIAEIYSEPGKEFREEIEMKDGRVYDRFGGPIKRDGIHYGWVWTFRDITESKLADWALEATQEELRNHANRLEEVVETRTAALRETISDLETFSYSVSHDLRAPLRAMQSFAQILSEDCGQQISPEGREYIRRISSAAARMDRLIQDVLTYSKVSRVNLELKPVEVEKVFRDILELYPMFKEPEAKLEFVPPFPAVLAAEAVLTQCFANLIGNGLKFVAPGTLPTMRIWSELAMDPSRVKIFFQDNGVGIAEGAHEVIFGIFQRLNVQFEGTGIGLAIVKKGVERMGGSVGLISSPGKGSLFWLELKVAERSPAPPPGQQKKN